jgi:hypothetical protein
MLYRGNDIIEDKYFKKIALDNGVPDQVDPKAIAKKWQTLPIWRYSLPGYNERYPGE